MSARAMLQAAAVAALEGAGLTAFDAPPVRGAMPHAVIDEPMLSDWSTKTWEGREGRLTLRFVDEGERPVRLRGAMEAGEAAVAAMPDAIGAGWRMVRVRLLKSRIVRERERWVGVSEFGIRMWRENG